MIQVMELIDKGIKIISIKMVFYMFKELEKNNMLLET